MNSNYFSNFFKMTMTCLVLYGCGSDSGGSLSDTPTETGTSASKRTGKYALTDILAIDRVDYESYRYTVSTGFCGFQLSESQNGWFLLQETNDCKLKDEYGDLYSRVSSGSFKIKLDAYGSLSDVDMTGGGTSTDNTSSSNILAMDLTFGTSSAVMKTVVELSSGLVVDYTYNFSKK
ncbi:MAG: hypothetical protein RIQ81_159 [Pseudomonadota bacterium]|jgi:hypothetical protein